MVARILRPNGVWSLVAGALMLGTSLVPGAFSQEVSEADERPRRLVVIVEGEGENLVYGESLVAALARERSDVIVRRLSADELPESGMDGLDADAWLRVTFSLEGDTLSIDFEGYDILTDTRVSDSYSTPSAQIREFQSRAWQPIVSTLDRFAVPRSRAGTLRVRGSEGMEIQVDVQSPVTLDSSGTADFQLPVPGTYTVSASRRGYWSQERSVSLDRFQEIEVALDPAPHFAAQFSLFNMQFPEIGTRWFPGRRSFYLGTGITSFAIGYALREDFDGDGDVDVRVSVPLTVFSLSAGSYLRGIDHSTRPYIGVQPFVRVVHGEDRVFEEFAPVGASAQIGLEYRPFPRGGIFLEWLPTIYPTDRVNELLEVSQRTGGSLAVGSERIFAELLLIRFGYRQLF